MCQRYLCNIRKGFRIVTFLKILTVCMNDRKVGNNFFLFIIFKTYFLVNARTKPHVYLFPIDLNKLSMFKSRFFFRKKKQINLKHGKNMSL